MEEPNKMGDQSLEEIFLGSCKTGDTDRVQWALQHNVNVNYHDGWPLRRSIRYNHPEIWRLLLQHKDIDVNLTNQYGLTALHTACRFNISTAVFDLLKHLGVSPNLKTNLGSSSLAVAAKYLSKEALEVIVRDRRIDLDVLDNQGRNVEQVVGIIVKEKKEDKIEILECLAREREWRGDEEGRSESIEEENIDVDCNHRLRVFDQIQELVGELQELHMDDRMKLTERQEAESVQYCEKLKRDMIVFIEDQKENQINYFNKIKSEKIQFDQRQQDEFTRIIKKQSQETLSLKCTTFKRPSCMSPKSANISNSHNTSLKTHVKVGSCEALSETSSGPSLWDWSVSDEGYNSSGKERGLPLMKELECPICLEVMVPPSAIWQCSSGHVICEQCKQRLDTTDMSTACPTCNTSPFIGRNLALERISQSLFGFQ